MFRSLYPEIIHDCLFSPVPVLVLPLVAGDICSDVGRGGSQFEDVGRERHNTSDCTDERYRNDVARVMCACLRQIGDYFLA
jgi:hypothetical protein